jgi:hypothetical protein
MMQDVRHPAPMPCIPAVLPRPLRRSFGAQALSNAERGKGIPRTGSYPYRVPDLASHILCPASCISPSFDAAVITTATTPA